MHKAITNQYLIGPRQKIIIRDKHLYRREYANEEEAEKEAKKERQRELQFKNFMPENTKFELIISRISHF